MRQRDAEVLSLRNQLERIGSESRGGIHLGFPGLGTRSGARPDSSAFSELAEKDIQIADLEKEIRKQRMLVADAQAIIEDLQSKLHSAVSLLENKEVGGFPSNVCFDIFHFVPGVCAFSGRGSGRRHKMFTRKW